MPPKTPITSLDALITLDIRELKRRGMLVPGERTERVVSSIKIIADLTVKDEQFLFLKLRGREAMIPLRETSGLKGPRWFLADEKDRRRDILYWCDVRRNFFSREAINLQYVSKRRTPIDRLLLKRDKLLSQLKNVRGPGTALRKATMQSELTAIETVLEGVGFGPARRFVDAKHNVADRQARSRARSQAVRQALQSRPTMSAKEVMELFRADFRTLKSQTRPPRGMPDAQDTPGTAMRDLTKRVLDIVTMQRLGHAVPGQLTGLELGWPVDWMNRPNRRIFVLFDLRDVAHKCVAIFIRDGRRKPLRQLIWLCDVIACFGRHELRFFESESGVCSRTLELQGDRFAFPVVTEGQPDPSHDSLEKMRRKLKRVMRKQGYAPSVSPLAEFERAEQREEDARKHREAARILPMAGASGQRRVVEKYRALVDVLKNKTPVRDHEQRRDHTQSADRVVDGHVDIVAMEVARYLQPGDMTAAELDWPREWIGKRDRSLYFLVDLREADRDCVIFVMQDPDRKPKAQLFWIHSAREGQVRWFGDPVSGALSRQLYYRRGKFRLPGRPTQVP